VTTRADLTPDFSALCFVISRLISVGLPSGPVRPLPPGVSRARPSPYLWGAAAGVETAMDGSSSKRHEAPNNIPMLGAGGMSSDDDRLIPSVTELRNLVSKPIGAQVREASFSSAASEPLGSIFIKCPRTLARVATGLSTQCVVFGSLPSVEIPLRCPACNQIHKWKPEDAWIESALPRASK
jgi:hypothetical protein